MPPLPESVQAKLDDVTRLLERHRVLESLAERQRTEKRDLLAQMQRRANLVELQRHLRATPPAHLALVLAALGPEERLLAFRQLAPRDAGLTLVDMDPAIRTAIIDQLEHLELTGAIAELDADDLAFLSESLPDDVVREASEALEATDRPRLPDASTYADDAVGRLMQADAIAVPLDQTVGGTLAALREGRELPEQTDRLFVVDARHLLRGAVRLQDLIRADPAVPLSSIMLADVAAFRPHDPVERAAQCFERKDLVSAPVVDDLGKLVGRITIDAVVDYARDASEHQALAQAGLRGAEDLLSPVSESVRNRWPWLAVNLMTAFVASRVIGAFEETIARTVALAALMPIVASIGGNTGNQTVALVIRALALDQLKNAQGRLARKELMVGAVNGITWGLVVGVLAIWLYHSAALAAVMAMAVFLNLVIAALAGVAVPLGLKWAGRDPAQGASVVLTFVTDGMGFFLFLGLARWLLA
jgi:magnesium transporter